MYKGSKIMKKVIGISIVAMFAVVPMMAGAAKTATLAGLQGTNGVITPNNQMATTSYVQGAYNALATEHNKVVNDITLTGERVDGDHISNTASVAENLETLNSAIKSLSSTGSASYVTKTSATAQALNPTMTLNYVEANGDQVGLNLGKLDAAVGVVGSSGNNYIGASTGENSKNVAENLKALDTAIGDMSGFGDQNYAKSTTSVAANITSLDTQVKTNTDAIGTYDESKSHIKISNQDVFTNLHVLDAQVSANSNNINSNTSAISANTTAIGNVSQLASVGGLIPENTDNLVDAVKAINTQLGNSNSNATIEAGNYVSAGQTVGAAVAALDTAIKNNADDIDDINDTIGNTAMGTTATTVTGAIAEMHGKKMTVYTTWNTNDTDEINMF